MNFPQVQILKTKLTQKKIHGFIYNRKYWYGQPEYNDKAGYGIAIKDEKLSIEYINKLLSFQEAKDFALTNDIGQNVVLKSDIDKYKITLLIM